MEQANYGRIAASPITKVVQDWYRRVYAETNNTANESRTVSQGPDKQLAGRVGASEDYIYRLRQGRYTWMNFDLADRIVLETIGPFGWHSEPDLAEVYQGFDLSRVDLLDPVSPNVDPLRAVEGLPPYEAGKVIGVPGRTIARLRKRRERVAERVAA